MVFYRLVQKHSNFQAYCKDRTQEFNGKKNEQPKIRKMVDGEPVVVFIQKLDKSDI